MGQAMKKYIYLSNLMEVDFLTGIQRVVREIVVRMLQKKEHEFVLLIYEYERNAFRLLDNDRFLKYFADGSGKRGGISTSVYMEFHEISPGTVFFDIDSVWNSRLKRSSMT